MKLDLGGTACYESEDAIIISLDGSDAGDDISKLIVGDYNNMPLPNSYFDEASGSCYLEEKPNWNELYRVMKPGARIHVKACDAGYAPREQMEADMRNAGFWILQWSVLDEDGCMDNPYVLEKPEVRGLA